MQEDDGGELNQKTLNYLSKEKNTAWRYVGDSLFVHNTEVSNKSYNEFLSYLIENNKSPDFEKFKVDSLQWFFTGLNTEISNRLARYYNNHSAYNEFPVVNISYDAAVEYCKYLTNKYNNGEHNYKHFFKKVKCRLPSRKEWVKAAKGGVRNTVFSWGRDYTFYKQGCFAGNFTYIDQSKIADSVVINDSSYNTVVGFKIKSGIPTVIVNWFFPNYYGLYNMCGNVAEMLNEPGTTIGGSWGTTAYYLRLDIESDPYAGWTEPSPYIGFRPVMVVIEE